MPLPVDRLTSNSSAQEIRDAISASIEQCMNEPIPEGYKVKNKQEWCAAKAYSIARRKTGKSIGGGKR
jgi:hypothetical protein